MFTLDNDVCLVVVRAHSGHHRALLMTVQFVKNTPVFLQVCFKGFFYCLPKILTLIFGTFCLTFSLGMLSVNLRGESGSG